jgi:ferredoxin-NADP reductase/MOSC domain-containing protein YiiM
MGRLLSVNVGLPRDVTWQDKTVHTGIWKTPIDGPRMVRRLNIDGDGQGDLAGHGGEHRAVLVYQHDSYQYWQNQLARTDFAYGQFGENFTVDGLSDAEVYIGDRYRIGGALFEVTQPRVTCYRAGIRMNEPEMAALLVKHGRPGFYFRVLEEGEVEAGDEITRVASGPERMSVVEIDALLYKPGHARDQLERALRIPALSTGWRSSFEALLKQKRKDGTPTGNAGLTTASGPPPAWRGFRPLRVSRKVRESGNVISLVLEPADGQPIAAALSGQFVVLRLGPESAPALMRSYSLSGEPGAAYYRVSVKREIHGAAGAYIDDELQVGDLVHASAARGSFTLRPGDTPAVLLSAGIGVTPVLAMLHALAAEASTREIWWLYGTRSRREHPFAEETRGLLAALPHRHSHICYSSPDPEDRVDFDSVGRLDMRVLQKLNLPRNGDFYICGPSSFMSDLTAGLAASGVAPDRIHTEIFGTGPSITPGVAAGPRRPPHLPAELPGSGPLVSFARSGLSVRWTPTFQSLLELAEACDVPVRWSCRAGVCHTCETALVAGTIGYRPDPVDTAARSQWATSLLICDDAGRRIFFDLPVHISCTRRLATN